MHHYVGKISVALCTCAFASIAATIDIDVSAVTGTTKRFERHNTWMNATRTTFEQNLYKDLPTESIRASWGWTSSTVAYEAQTRAIGVAPVYNVWGYTSDFAKYEEELYNNLLALKAKWPNMVWVEICNEPDGSWYSYNNDTKDVTNNNYVNLLLAGGRAVTRANAKLAAGVPQLKVGGPVTYKWNPYFIEETIKRVAAKGGRLDGVIWHDYHRPQSPGDFVAQCKQVRGWIKEYGFSDSTQIVITEWGLFPGSEKGGTNPSSELLLQSATFVAAGNYFWMEGGADIVHQWVVRHQTAYAKSQLAPEDNKVYPFYNVLKAMSMNKAQRVKTTITNGMSSSGVGVGGYGTADQTGAAAFLWNYEAAESSTTVKFANLPSNYTSGPVTYKVYLIDDTHSNYKYNSSKDALEMIESGTFTSGSFSKTLTLKKNSVAFISLTPSKEGAVSVVNSAPHRNQKVPALSSSMHVTDLFGRTVDRKMVSKGKNGIRPGVYFVRDNDSRQPVRIVKK